LFRAMPCGDLGRQGPHVVLERPAVLDFDDAEYVGRGENLYPLDAIERARAGGVVDEDVRLHGDVIARRGYDEISTRPANEPRRDGKSFGQDHAKHVSDASLGGQPEGRVMGRARQVVAQDVRVTGEPLKQDFQVLSTRLLGVRVVGH
jgi:hypothetical protein